MSFNNINYDYFNSFYNNLVININNYVTRYNYYNVNFFVDANIDCFIVYFNNYVSFINFNNKVFANAAGLVNYIMIISYYCYNYYEYYEIFCNVNFEVKNFNNFYYNFIINNANYFKMCF